MYEVTWFVMFVVQFFSASSVNKSKMNEGIVIVYFVNV